MNAIAIPQRIPDPMTPRTVKASEVVKGMRVRWEDHYSDATVTTEGLVSSATNGTAFAHIDLGSARQVGRSIDKDHPVTVLAEPEPEWVEGAWYWTRYKDDGETERTLRHRMAGGWSVAGTQTETKPAWVDESDEITVLGRVLIVDWPGDDVARGIERTYTPGGKWIATENTAAQIIADAIRTQGGAR